MSPVTALYVPGDRPDRFDKAVASGADVVIFDLEDSVAAGHKAAARTHVAHWLAGRDTADVQVRVNAAGSGWLADDLAALPPGVAVRLPKVESPGDVDAVGDREVHALLETALGVEQAFEVASHPLVASIALGEADLAAELAVTDEQALAWVRMRTVVAARASGLPAPMMAAYPQIRDVEGLARSCALGRSLGMHGRTAIHPSQLPVIAAAFGVSDDDRAWAREVLSALERSGGGVATLPSGEMVDAAMARRARSLIAARR